MPLFPKDFVGRRKEPLWRGPEKDGVTSSLLSRFLCCRERFRLLVIEGWKPVERWNHRIEFGNMWHGCEESLAKQEPWEKSLESYTLLLCERYPMQRQEVAHYANICLATFGEYVRYWSTHPDVQDRTPIGQEQVFSVNYTLPSGRKVKLRGKFDAYDLIGAMNRDNSTGVFKSAGIYLQENKSKSSIDDRKIAQQLLFDLQTMLYLVALGEVRRKSTEEWTRYPILGVRYNVVRRSMHKLTPKDGDYDGFNARLVQMMREAPSEWFARWKVEVTPSDINKFKVQCLNPVLEQLCDWWAWVTSGIDIWCGKAEDPDSPAVHNRLHFRFPSGVYNPTLEGQEGDLDEMMNTGSTIGLVQTNNLYPELASAEGHKTVSAGS